MFKEPKILPACKHNVCKECVQGIFLSSVITNLPTLVIPPANLLDVCVEDAAAPTNAGSKRKKTEVINRFRISYFLFLISTDFNHFSIL